MDIDTDWWSTISEDTMFWSVCCEYIFHTFSYQDFPYLCLIFWYIEDELIMNLQYHLASQRLFANLRIYIDHRIFEHISSTSLHGHIDPFTLRDTTDCFVSISESGDIAPPTKSRLYISECSTIFEDRLIVVFYSWIFLIKCPDISICFPR